MKQITFFITLSILSLSVFSASNVYTTQNNTTLRLDKASVAKVLKTLPKDIELQRLTMHYSGWSQVRLNDLSGWILSNHLTLTKPKNTNNIVAKSSTNVDNNKQSELINNLKKSLENLQLTNKALMSKIIDTKALKTKISTENNTDLTLLEQKNTELSSLNNDLQSQLNSVDSDNNINILFSLILGLIIGFIISIIVARLAQKKHDSFNTINRSY